MAPCNKKACVERRTSAKDPICAQFGSCSACFKTESWRQKGAPSQPLSPGPLGARTRAPTPPSSPLPEWDQYRAEPIYTPHNPPPSARPPKAAVSNLLSRDYHDAIIKYSQRRREPLFKGRSMSPPPPAPRHLQPSKTNVDFYRGHGNSIYHDEPSLFNNFVQNLPAKTNIDNSATLSELKKDFNTVLLEKQAQKMAQRHPCILAGDKEDETLKNMKNLYRRSSRASPQVSVRSRSATPTRVPNLHAPRLTIFQDGVGPRKDLGFHRPADACCKHHVNVPIQDAQPRTLIRSDRSYFDQVLTKLGRPRPHYDQTVPLQVGLQLAKC